VYEVEFRVFLTEYIRKCYISLKASLRICVRKMTLNAINFLYLHAKDDMFVVYGCTASFCFLALPPSRPTLNSLRPSFYSQNGGYSETCSNVSDSYVREWNFPLLVVQIANILIGKRGGVVYFGVLHAGCLTLYVFATRCWVQEQQMSWPIRKRWDCFHTVEVVSPLFAVLIS
jgi:hypothetical protein